MVYDGRLGIGVGWSLSKLALDTADPRRVRLLRSFEVGDETFINRKQDIPCVDVTVDNSHV